MRLRWRGILCKHSISVLIKSDVETLPKMYILRRWRRDVNRTHTRVAVSDDSWACTPGQLRYYQMCKEFAKVAESVAEDEKETQAVMQWIQHRLLTSKTRHRCGINLHSQQNVLVVFDCVDTKKSTNEAVLDTKYIGRKGAPRKSRIKSVLERKVKKQKVPEISKKGVNKNQFCPSVDVAFTPPLQKAQYHVLTPPSDLQYIMGVQPLNWGQGMQYEHPMQEEGTSAPSDIALGF